LLDNPYWISQPGRTITVRILHADQFAQVIEGEQPDPTTSRDQHMFTPRRTVRPSSRT
jgi:hypothetical protein